MTYLWPRLGHGAATELAEKLSVLESPEDLAALADIAHPAASPAATGGPRVPDDVILSVQGTLRTIATEHGFPKRLPAARVATVDRAWSLPLHDLMRIIPADAAHEGVWSFLTLVVVPELALWRFPSAQEERLIGRPRNVFRRLWWRIEVLGPELGGVDTPLGEDELVQIMERPSLASGRAVAEGIASRVAAYPPSKGGRSEIMRDYTKRVLRRMPVTNLDVLDDGHLAAVLDAEFAAAVAAVTRG